MDGASLIRGDALRLPFADESVDLIPTSPPYFALRSYQDDGGHYDGQIGSEETPGAFLDALWAVTAECVRVLKPSGSMWVNLGDKYAGSGGHNNAGLRPRTGEFGTRKHSQPGGAYEQQARAATRRSAPDRYNQNSDGIPAKSLMGLPWRYAIGCIDQLGLILRAEVIWSKPNGLPESVTDRVRRSHEQWFHFTKQGRYYSAVDEIREPHHAPSRPSDGGLQQRTYGETVDTGEGARRWHPAVIDYNPLGKLPGSVWEIPTEPLQVPDHLGVDHFAAFPQEWPRRIILGWSPSGICTQCGEGRRPEVDASPMEVRPSERRAIAQANGGAQRTSTSGTMTKPPERTITGYSCACPTPTAPTRPAIVLDPFAGTGTVPMVARALGRYGIGVDLSAAYLRLARWRVFESGHELKTVERTLGPTEAESRRRRAEMASMGQTELFG